MFQQQRPYSKAPGQGVGTLTGILDGSCPHAEIVAEQSGRARSRVRRLLEKLATVPADGSPHTVDLPGVGNYRVLLHESEGLVFVTGLPTGEVDDTFGRLIGLEAIVALIGVGLAAVAGLALVRRQLRPLREVAATAAEVTRTPLDSGAVGTTARVPEEYAHPDNEVGQLGEALNLMLGHVERALDARHESEQQVRQFLADASHELRTPLSTIAGYAELSRRKPGDDESQLAQLRHAMDRVDVESGRMTALVDDLLLLARLDAGRPLESETVDLSRLVLEAVDDARVVAPDHQWRLSLPEEPVLVSRGRPPSPPGGDQPAVQRAAAHARRHGRVGKRRARRRCGDTRGRGGDPRRRTWSSAGVGGASLRPVQPWRRVPHARHRRLRARPADRQGHRGSPPRHRRPRQPPRLHHLHPPPPPLTPLARWAGTSLVSRGRGVRRSSGHPWPRTRRTRRRRTADRPRPAPAAGTCRP